MKVERERERKEGKKEERKKKRSSERTGARGEAEENQSRHGGAPRVSRRSECDLRALTLKVMHVSSLRSFFSLSLSLSFSLLLSFYSGPLGGKRSNRSARSSPPPPPPPPRAKRMPSVFPRSSYVSRISGDICRPWAKRNTAAHAVPSRISRNREFSGENTRRRGRDSNGARATITGGDHERRASFV